MKLTEFNIEINKEQVLEFIDCKPDSPIYESTMEELEEILPEAYEKIKPVALFGFGDLLGVSEEYKDESPEVLYAIVSVGREISQWSSKLFEENDYLLGMLVDAIADNYLFQMDELAVETVRDLCHEKKKGVSARLEAPQDIPMIAQKKGFLATNAEKLANIRVVETSYMYDPVKTTCQVYVLTEDTDCLNVEHNCSTCQNRTCKMRNVSEYYLTIIGGNELNNSDARDSITSNDMTNSDAVSDEQKQIIKIKDNTTILEGLKENGIHLSAICAGRGTCGKCRIRLVDGHIPVTEKDKEFFDESELEKGYRLACRDYLSSDCIIDISESVEDEFEAVVGFGGHESSSNNNFGISKNAYIKNENTDSTSDIGNDDTFAIACDIGTTTIAVQLFSLESGDVVDTFTTINRQRAYGGDVISRIDASNSGKKDELQNCIREDLALCVNRVTENGRIKVEKMTIAANTTMVHLLMGYSCEGLGVYPFTPVNIDTIEITYAELVGGDDREFPVTILPGISTYVGGDIVSGLYSLDFNKRKKISALIDLGTNGEMAVGNKDKILVASTAAGPAFEGGNIIHGIGSIPGAICGVEITGADISYKTIGEKEPTGICGTGVVDTVYELLKNQLIDETGMLDDEYVDDGFELATHKNGNQISFHQKDVREIQLAKSAVRAGFETLLLRYGVSYDDIDQVFIAGGFGYKIDITKAVGIGLFPEELEDKIVAVGNSSLKGAYQYTLNENCGESAIEDILNNAEEIGLSGDKDFNELYMEYMYFE